MKRFVFFVVCFFPLFLYAETDKPVIEFSEVWAYLMVGEEKYLDAAYPISDLAYFSAGINYYGKLVGVPEAKKVNFFKGRVHLVIAELGNQALTHFCLSPDFPIRNALIEDIVEASAKYAGVQIDFEAINSADKEAFFSFLASLKEKLGTKMLSVAVPARLSDIKNDRYDYTILEKIADRIMVMAYDEHWSTSKPGSIASIDWCKNVSSYSLSRVTNSKLIMGMPCYGRAWADKNPATAYRHAGITRIISEKNITDVQRKEGTPYIEYQETVNVKVYYEDALSLFHRMNLYKSSAVSAISFWRLGQEDKDVWKYLSLSKMEVPVKVTESATGNGTTAITNTAVINTDTGTGIGTGTASVLTNVPENIQLNLPANLSVSK